MSHLDRLSRLCSDARARMQAFIQINAIRHDRAHSTKVTAAIASGSDSGVLAALESNEARLLLWFALAGLVIAMRQRRESNDKYF